MKYVPGMMNRVAHLQMLRAFHHRDYAPVFLSTVTMSIGRFMMMVTLSWLVLEMTDSPLSLGMVWAMRSAPNLIFGMLAGAVADKVDRRKLLIWAFAVLMACAISMGILISKDLIQLWHILLFSFLIGSITTFAITACQAFVVDIVGLEDAMTALSMNAVAMRSMGVFGGFVAGVVIELLGVAWPFYIMVVGYVFGLIALLFVRGVVQKAGSGQESIRSTFVGGLRIIFQNQIVRILMMMAIICEIFGFSYLVVLPIFARDTLDVGVIGLGMLNSMQAVGGLLAALVLASLGNYRYKGWLILGVFLVFGVSLVCFSQSPWYLTSLLLVGIIGAMAAAFDALQHNMLQLNVSEEQRGRAVGIWQLSIGFGPVGHLAVGAVATLFGAQLALSVNGITIAAIFFILVVFVSKLRRA